MMGTLMLDNYTSKKAISMAVHHSVPSNSKVGGVSGTVALPSPTIMTLSNYMYKEEEELEIDFDLMAAIEADAI